MMDGYISRSFQHSTQRMYLEWNELLSDTLNYDAIILGSSETWVGVNPQIISDTIPYKVRNLSLNGCNFDRIIDKYSLYTSQYPAPQLLLVNIGFNFLSPSSDYEKQQYFPYLFNSQLRPILVKNTYLNWAEKYLPMYRYFGYSKEVRQGLHLQTIKEDDHLIAGYCGKELKYNDIKYSKDKSFNFSVANSEIVKFHQFIQLQHSRGTKVLFFYTPMYANMYDHIINVDEMLSTYQAIADTYAIPILNYLDGDISQDKTNFYNNAHLNKKGSYLFSYQLAHDLKKYFKED
ncbi:hypothetical protein N9251_02130 [Gammaproteobacteria bacterium]|nr:hypothetical protein [Gammaproteobacteria bacterium]